MTCVDLPGQSLVANDIRSMLCIHMVHTPRADVWGTVSLIVKAPVGGFRARNVTFLLLYPRLPAHRFVACSAYLHDGTSSQ